MGTHIAHMHAFPLNSLMASCWNVWLMDCDANSPSLSTLKTTDDLNGLHYQVSNTFNGEFLKWRSITIILYINTGTVFVCMCVCLPHARSRERKVASPCFLHRREELRLASCTNHVSSRYNAPLGRKRL